MKSAVAPAPTTACLWPGRSRNTCTTRLAAGPCSPLITMSWRSWPRSCRPCGTTMFWSRNIRMRSSSCTRYPRGAPTKATASMLPAWPACRSPCSSAPTKCWPNSRAAPWTRRNGPHSVAAPGVARGPHEHVDQADFFCFIGPSNFKVYLWDNRPQSKTYLTRQTDIAGSDKPAALIIPAGVVHAYKNVGTEPGLVFNCPNRLYKGPGRKEPVDEIRHEEDSQSRFRLD